MKHGYIYIAQPPLYKVQQGKRIEYAYNDKELEQILSELPKLQNRVYSVIKVLGEMNPEQLWETTMDPEQNIASSTA